MSDSVLCTSCGSGWLIPGKGSADWICTKCEATSSGREVSNRINYWWNVIQDADTSDISLSMELLDQMSRIFHQNHYYLIEIKRRLVENIDNTKNFESEDLAIGLL